MIILMGRTAQARWRLPQMANANQAAVSLSAIFAARFFFFFAGLLFGLYATRINCKLCSNTQ